MVAEQSHRVDWKSGFVPQYARKLERYALRSGSLSTCDKGDSVVAEQ
jgi:hypothetical protein